MSIWGALQSFQGERGRSEGIPLELLPLALHLRPRVGASKAAASVQIVPLLKQARV